MIFPSVDLPAPFSPTSAWIDPRAMPRSMSESACTPPKRFETPRASRRRPVHAGTSEVDESRGCASTGRPDWNTPVTAPGSAKPGEVARIAVEHDGIEEVALLEAPELVLHAAELGAARGRREQRLLDREPGLVHEQHFLEVASVLLALDVVGARRELHAVLLRDPDARADVEPEGEDLLARVGVSEPSSAQRRQSRIAERVGTRKQPDFAIAAACSSVRKPPCSTDRTPAATAFVSPSPPYACTATCFPFRPASNTATAISSGVSSGDQGLVVLRDEAAGDGELDPVCACTEVGAHDVPHRLRPVDDEGRPPRKRGDQTRFEARAAEEAVSVAARLADEGDGDLQPRPGHMPFRIDSRSPRSAPERSRTKVTPASSVRRAFCAASSAHCVTGVLRISAMSTVDIVTWSWQSKMPGSSQRPRSRSRRRPARQVPVDARDPAVVDVDVHRAAEAAAPVEHHDLPQDVRFAVAHRKASSRARAGE